MAGKPKNPMRPVTLGERLWVYKRRMGWDNATVARMYKTTLNRVSEWLNDHEGIEEDCPEVVISELERHEQIALARRRKGWTIREAAEREGISHVTLIKRERGDGEVGDTWTWWEREVGWPAGPGAGWNGTHYYDRDTESRIR